MRPVLFTLLLLSLCVACGRSAAIDARVPVGSVALHIVCRGEGEPVVVLDSGLGNDARVWSAVQPDVAQTTTVCVYDRAGLGASSSAPRPHTNLMMAEELRALLRNARLPSPYILVGHSMGGVNIRLLAQSHPDALAGMVLVDAMSEWQPKEFWSLIPDADMANFREGIGQLPEGTDFETLSKGLSDVAMAKDLGATPLVVLSHDLEDAPPGAGPDAAERLRSAWQNMQKKLSRLSTNRAYVVVKGTHHAIQREQPQVVAAAIRAVVRAAREHRSVDDSLILSTIR